MNNQKVSVIIPVFNREHLVSRAIKSVLNQTYADFELIIVDDCSTDNTRKVIKSFVDNRIRYIEQKEKKGAGGSRNTGIANSKGRYMAFLDSDDEWLMDKLEKQIKLIQSLSDKCGLIYSGVSMVSEKTGKVADVMVPKVRGNVYLSTLFYCVIGGCSTPLIKKECFEKCGIFDETLQSLEDWEMWMRIGKYYEFDFVPDILVKRYIHGEQITTTLDGKIQARAKIILKHQNELLKYPSIYADHFNRLGIFYSLGNNFVQSKDCYLKSLKIKPLQKFAYLHLILLAIFPKLYVNILKRNINKESIDGIPLYW